MVRISFREYVQDITTGDIPGGSTVTAFKLQKFNLNPGLANTFPWFSTIANNFLKYHVGRIKFHFVSTSATALASTNTALGIVAMRYQGDPTVAVDSGIIQMQNSNGCKRASPMHSFGFDCPIVPSHLSTLTIRSGGQPPNTDLRMYDCGYFELATVGMQAAATNIGQLWVEFTFNLFEPVLKQGVIGATLMGAHLRNAVTLTSDYDDDTPIGTASSTVLHAGCTLAMSVIDDDKLVFPSNLSVGRYQVHILWSGYSSAACALVAPTLTNCVYVKSFTNDTVTWSQSPAPGQTAKKMFIGFTVDITGLGAYMTFPGGSYTLPTSNKNIDIYVQQVNSEFS